MSNRNRLADKALEYIKFLENDRLLVLSDFIKSYADIVASLYNYNIRDYINIRYYTYSGNTTFKNVILINRYSLPSKLKIYVTVTSIHKFYKVARESNLLMWSVNYRQEIKF